MSEYILRFSPRQRIEHLVTLVTFVMLCLTGLPQKFFSSGWAQAIVDALGGVDRVRALHRFFGLTLALATVVHFASALLTIARRDTRLSMVPDRKDFSDSVHTLKYYLGLEAKLPPYDRYDYKQKFEYWGLVMGNVIMVVSGFVLYFPTIAARVVPGEVIPAAKMAHSNEGLMAFLVIAIWHGYNSILAPEVFPLDTAIFTGKISRARMLHEHPVELARIEGKTLDELLAEGHGDGHDAHGGDGGHAGGDPGGKRTGAVPHESRRVG